MLYFPSGGRPPPPLLDLNALVDQLTRSMNVRRLPRDLPTRDRSQLCLDFLTMCRRRTIRLLPEEYQRPPYAAHVAVSLIDSGHMTSRMRDLGQMLVLGTKSYNPTCSYEQLKELYEDFGQEDVDACIKWLAREFFARNAIYGTQAMYLRSHFLKVLAATRWALEARYPPPKNYEQITACLIEIGVIRTVAFHRSRGEDFPGLRLVGQGRLHVDRPGPGLRK